MAGYGVSTGYSYVARLWHQSMDRTYRCPVSMAKLYSSYRGKGRGC